MKPILAIETTTRTGSIAVLRDDETGLQLFDGAMTQQTGHAETVLPLIDSVIRQAGIDRHDLGLVAFGQGPGAFTGIRLGCSVAQGIALALGLPVVAVNSLQAVAAAFDDGSAVTLVALDARMQEVYFGAYGPGGIELQAPVLLAAGDVPRFMQPRLKFWQRAVGSSQSASLVGEGWQVVNAEVDQDWMASLPVQSLDTEARPHAREVALVGRQRWQAGQTLLPEQALPLYLRDKVAFTTEERQHGLGGNPKVAANASAPSQALLLPMMPVDINDVVELERQSQAFPWSRRNFEDALAARYSAWVLRLNDTLAGFCVAMPTPDDVHLLVIAVAPDYRRKGLATQLLAQVEQLARDHGVSRVLLEVRPSNTRALAFYAKQGFVEIGKRRGYYPAGKGEREDALVLAREVRQLAV
ncbi:MAG: tRNA (adenosine(37)-N6)-threonylcarbamoyltransferase complex dimerization subunit type 1 TsaB [Burkholderiaceae bacterium]|nr:tRNA (adenosine(37)-N6)-threonylcarbamoyltransferase complex dimerization subunit type 1 TsaB [Burkholderiaceae bacterium]MCD8515693.1 tRNA (adenosine(37)-N6)-threonylcarbamoyltransferase complex dimerization subunit type 1 TsaB [Burkholderiaceae bacterium]MCD8564093.1 tRNA (adenosine(37)-N6)-threonylcarbamoyltransferase complex dimerization subunit type 1 TsaB [Burkholderiaceae bacterium]